MCSCSHLSFLSCKPWAGLRGEDSKGEDGQVKKLFLCLETKYRYRRVVWCDHHRRLGRQPQWILTGLQIFGRILSILKLLQILSILCIFCRIKYSFYYIGHKTCLGLTLKLVATTHHHISTSSTKQFKIRLLNSYVLS